MASKAKLQMVNPSNALLTASAMLGRLREDITAKVPNKDLTIALSPDGAAFDITLELAPFTDHTFGVHTLISQPIEGVQFSNVSGRRHGMSQARHIITARVTAPGDA